jgi:hypothetical protein
MSKQSCGNCGKAVPIKNKFCGACGSGTLVDPDFVSQESAPHTRDEAEQFEGVKKDSAGSIILKIIAGLAGLTFLFAIIPMMASEVSVEENQTAASQNSQPPANTQTSILDEDAYQFVNSGEALVTLQNLWGISLSDASGYITLRELTDYSFDYLQRSVGGAVTKENITVGFEPGNSLNSFFSRLFNDLDAYYAVMERMLYLAV